MYTIVAVSSDRELNDFLDKSSFNDRFSPEDEFILTNNKHVLSLFVKASYYHQMTSFIKNIKKYNIDHIYLVCELPVDIPSTFKKSRYYLSSALNKQAINSWCTYLNVPRSRIDQLFSYDDWLLYQYDQLNVSDIKSHGVCDNWIYNFINMWCPCLFKM